MKKINSSNEVKVTIRCIVYNHAKFLRKCLEGFVNQKTNFRYQIVIHDDASTDGSAEIIQEFVNNYPELFVAILQKENQYSQGVKIGEKFVNDKCIGEYIAICEGDDYWTDNDKLQKQYDFMISHPNCTLCAHAVTWVNNKTNKTRYYGPGTESRFYSADEVILGGGGFVATCSLMVRRDIYFNRPACFSYRGVGDFQLQMHSAFSGDFYYMSDCMAVYNYMSSSASWSSKRGNAKQASSTSKRKVTYTEMLENVDKYYEYKYTDAIQKRIAIDKFKAYLRKGEYKELKSQKYKKQYKELTLKNKIKITMGAYFPWLFKLLKAGK